jgi:uncharacterized protein (DUF4213/DUF364 family)
VTIASEILSSLPEGRLVEVRLGLHWTAVVAEVAGELRCGLASTQSEARPHGSEPEIPAPGELERMSAGDLAAWVESEFPLRRSLGAAAVNALLPRPALPWHSLNGEEVIARLGAGKSVAVVGHFPFVDRLRERVGRLWVLERRPGPRDEPEEAAATLLPQADVVALTGATFVNGTLEALLALCRPGGRVLVLGPSTPLSPVLYAHGVDVLSGAIVEAPEPVVRAVSQGAGFHQIHALGVRLITVARQGVVIPATLGE